VLQAGTPCVAICAGAWLLSEKQYDLVPVTILEPEGRPETFRESEIRGLTTLSTTSAAGSSSSCSRLVGWPAELELW